MDRLLEDVEAVSTRGLLSSADVTSVEYDSRKTGRGALFCCIRGEHSDGHDFAAQAVRQGAVGLLAERDLALEAPEVVVPAGSVRRAMALAAANLYGHPAESLVTIGVTGTNGKTTVTHLLASILEANAMPTTVIGTLGGPRTTPESPALQKLLAQARDGGRRAAALEVSSHALTQGRVDGIRFAAAVFTNLGQDHLDHHGTMDEYFAAKASLFVPERAALAVVRADDPWGTRLIEQAQVPIVGYSLADASDVESDETGTRFTWRSRSVFIRLAGDFQVANALAAATTAFALGVPVEVVVEGLERAEPVPGRFEVVDTPLPFATVVDYAHTPEGLEASLDSARRLSPGHRVIVVFGAGGERDREKRPAMGEAAARGADLVVVTSDNPRGEDPAEITRSVLAGIPASAEVVNEPDRRRAIESALASALPGDVVVVAGKGHESEIEVRGERIEFNDRAEVRRAASRIAEERSPARGAGQ